MHEYIFLVITYSYSLIETTQRPTTTTTTTTEVVTESGRSFESTPDTLYGAPPLQPTTEQPPNLYGAPPIDESNVGYGAIPPGTDDLSYTAVLPPPRPTTVEKV